MKRMWIFSQIVLVLALLLSACGGATPTVTQVPTKAPEATKPVEPTKAPAPTIAPTSNPEDVLYVNITWHQHQPLYYKNEAGIYTRPWVRVHATKDYYDMAAIIQKYPNVRMTINLTPVLIRQLDDYAAGAKDLYWVVAEKPAAQLTEDDKRFILQRFYDANWKKIIAVHPRYQELLDKRGGSDTAAIDAAIKSFTEQDFRDLQIWFNLAWFDPDFLAEDPLVKLVEKGKNFTEEDKKILFDKTLDVIKKIIPLHRQLQEKGQIEVITTPYSHPILPLLVDSNLAKVGNPGADLPDRYMYAQDALAQLQKSVEIYTNKMGVAPRGLWPGEGSVAQAVVPFIIKSGYVWMGTGEPVLAKSLGIDSFSRDSKETVQKADELYRPYYVQNANGDKLAVFFRDGVISDKVGFTYSGVSGAAATKDLMQRLENVRARLKEEKAKGPHIVSIILDGENAWENYDNDGKEFFNSLYQALSDSKTLKTITPSEYLKLYPEQKIIKDLFPGAWFSPNYDTWIGESEEVIAWNYLGKVRADLEKYVQGIRKASPEALAKALDFMYLAEGSDWFWWYGSDQDSGQDDYFDQGYRALLAEVYKSLGEPVPNFVNVPIIQPKVVAAANAIEGLTTPVVDGKDTPNEWAKAAQYPVKGKTSTGFAYTMDAKNLYFKVNLAEGTKPERVGIYLTVPRFKDTNPFARPKDKETSPLTGITATHLFEWAGKAQLDVYLADATGWTAKGQAGQAAGGVPVLEAAIPLASLGDLEPGDEIRAVVVVQPANELLPGPGPAQVILPDLTQSKALLEVNDPEGDDTGPGTYTYPTDGVFPGKAYDLKSFRISADEKNITFKITLNGAIPNPWGSPNNLSIQTVDVYVDKDPGKGTGGRLLLPGRNASFSKEYGWEYALWAEGWTPQVLVPDAKGGEPKPVTEATFKILVDPAARTITLRVPRSVFGDGDPTKWGYMAVILGQEGYPSAGVWRVRDVEEKNGQWRFGGAPADTNHTRIIDLIWPGDKKPTQAEMLGTYPASKAEVGTLKPEEFGQIQMLVP